MRRWENKPQIHLSEGGGKFKSKLKRSGGKVAAVLISLLLQLVPLTLWFLVSSEIPRDNSESNNILV